jgi:hypothetical protein
MVATRSLPRRWLFGLLIWMWHWLRRPWLALLAGFIGLVLTLAVLQLPQLPGQLVDEPATAARWQQNTSTTYGIWGNLMLALGLFDVLRSPLLYLLLALLLPTLAAQLADQLGALRQVQKLKTYALAVEPEAIGTPIPISSVRTLYRWRGVIEAVPAAAAGVLEEKISQRFTTSTREDAPVRAAAHTATEEVTENEGAEPVPTVETRLHGTRFARLLLLRPLLMVGLLTAVVGALIALAFGWQVTAPPLAPGTTYRSVNRNLALLYTVSPTATVATALEVHLQGEDAVLAADRATTQRVGLATVQVRPTYPGVWIATTDGSEGLALPDRSALSASLGLVFDSPGSEESVLLPNQAAGLRIVQRGNNNGFVLELYRSDAVLPVYRAELTQGGRLTIPLDPGGTELIVSTLPGIQVNVRYLPGLWLVWCGILLAIIGTLAFVRQAGFVVAQIAPWPMERSLIVLQSDHAQTIDELRAVLATLTPPPASDDRNGAPASNPAPDDPLSPTLDQAVG